METGHPVFPSNMKTPPIFSMGGFAKKPHIRAEFAIFLFTEEGMLNATETIVCILSEF